MRWPLLPVALWYIAGILAADWIHLPLLYGFSGALILACLGWRFPQHRGLLLGVLLFLAGWLNQTRQYGVVSPYDVRRIVGPEPALATLAGTLCRPPTERRLESDSDSGERWQTMALIDLRAIRLDSDWRPARGKVMCRLPDRLPAPFWHGQAVQAQGVLKSPPPARHIGLFDYRRHLARRGIHRLLETDTLADWQWTGSQPRPEPLSRKFQSWAREALADGLPEVDDAVRLIYAMTLGWRTALNGEVAEPFMYSGTMHIFAISGLHITLIAGILVQLAKLARIPRRACGLLVIPMLWCYAAATGWQASATRATVMMSVIIAGWALKRPSNLLNSLAAAALAILLYDPGQLFQAGFQLSFSVVATMALIMPHIIGLKKQFRWSDPLLPEALRSRWHRCLDAALNFLLFSLAASISAWLGSMPIIAHYFNLATPVSLTANVLIVPLAGLTLMSAMGSLITDFWWASGSVCFNHGAWFWMQCMRGISHWMSEVPYGHFHVTSPGLPAFLIYYALILGMALGWLGRSIARLAGASALCLAAALAPVLFDHVRPKFRVEVVPAYGGGVVRVDAPGRSGDLLIDCGNEFSVEQITMPWLRSQGISRLPHFLMTHGDVNQLGGTLLLKERFEIGEFRHNSAPIRSRPCREIMEQLASSGVPLHPVQGGDELCGFEVIHPMPGDKFSRADDGTLVLQGTFFGIRLLLLSDLGRAGQNTLIERYPDLRADVVVAGMPRNDEPVRDALLAMLQPRLLVVANSRFPAAHHGSRALRRRLQAHPFPVVFTADSGGVRLHLRSGRARLEGVAGDLWREEIEAGHLNQPNSP